MKDGFISVACGAPKLRLADCDYNAEQTFTMMRAAAKAGVKVLVLVLVACGMASMWAAVFGDVGVSVLAILNAIRALGYKRGE